MQRRNHNVFLRILILSLIVFFLHAFTAHNDTFGASIIYVDDDSTGLNDGSSWENAYIHLQDALLQAKLMEKPVEIRVAQGIYTPDKGVNLTPGDYEASFELINGVTLSGGYAGTIETDPNTRDIELYKTILSGDLQNDDPNIIDPDNTSIYLDNSYNVINASFTDETSILDGFTISGGNATGDYLNYDSTSRGGGMYIEQGRPIISNCIFKLNIAYAGGCIYNKNSAPTINDCRFMNNLANPYYYIISSIGGLGGGIYNHQSSPNLTNCVFQENHSNSGGGIYNYDSNSVATNCTFSFNVAYEGSGGGLFNYFSNSIATDCNFIGNYTSHNGGGISNHNNLISSVNKCTFTANQSEDSGGGIFNDSGDFNIRTVHLLTIVHIPVAD